jgi:hypothetical protein
MLPIPEEPSALWTLLVFVLLVAPVYLTLRFLVGLVRHAYGFDGGDEGDPLRICARCHNTVLEPDFQHCPYCGAELEGAPSGTD